MEQHVALRLDSKYKTARNAEPERANKELVKENLESCNVCIPKWEPRQKNFCGAI